MSYRNLDVIGISGSLRSGSFNTALLETARDIAPKGLRITMFSLDDIPLYNQDLDNDEDRPEPVRRLKSAIENADAVLLVTPEYNFGIPGVLKNAIDWASRPGFASPMMHKPVGMMGASLGASGTMRAQEHLKLALLGMGSQVFPHPGVAVADGPDKVEDGRVTHAETRDFVQDYLEGFARWVAEVRAAVPAAV